MSQHRFTNKLLIDDITDSVSITTGALQITNGGLAISKNVSIGDSAKFYGTNSNYTAIKSADTANNITITLPNSLPTSSGSYLVSDTFGNFTYSDGITSSSTSFIGAQNVGPVNITGLSYTSGSFEKNISVNVIATTSLTEIFKLSGILSSGASGWNLTTIALSGDLTNIEFSITSGGQIQYTSPSYPGFTSLTFTWSDYISSNSVINLISGENTVAPITSNSGVFFHVNSAISTDTITASSGTLNDFNGTYIGKPTLTATNTLVTTTNASTVYIAGEPITGTNETITNKYALKVLGKVGLAGNTSGTVSLIVPDTFTSYNYNFPVSGGEVGQSFISGGPVNPSTWGYAQLTATTPGTFVGANNTGPVNITGLIYSGATEDFVLHMKVAIVTTPTTGNAKEYFIIYGIKSNNAATGWSLTSTAVAGNTTNVDLTITGTGQIQYTTPNIANFVSVTFTWK
jgi:hypothetical protein